MVGGDREEERITTHKKKGKKDGREGVKILHCFERPICSLVPRMWHLYRIFVM